MRLVKKLFGCLDNGFILNMLQTSYYNYHSAILSHVFYDKATGCANNNKKIGLGARLLLD